MESNQDLYTSTLSEEEINALLDELTKTNTSEKRNVYGLDSRDISADHFHTE